MFVLCVNVCELFLHFVTRQSLSVKNDFNQVGSQAVVLHSAKPSFDHQGAIRDHCFNSSKLLMLSDNKAALCLCSLKLDICNLLLVNST